MGAGIILAMLGCAVTYLVRRDIWLKPHLLFCSLALIITAAHAWVDFQFHNPAILVLWCVSAILIGRWTDLESRRNPRM